MYYELYLIITEDTDDIFKGSHSSNFFSNRNHGREDAYQETTTKLKANDIKIQKTRPTTSTTKRVSQTVSSSAASSTIPISSTTPSINLSKKTTIHKNNFVDYNQLLNKTSTLSTFVTSSTAAPRVAQNAVSKISFTSNDYLTNVKIQPTTYNPNRLKSSPKYNELKQDSADLYYTKSFSKSAPTSRNGQKSQDTQQQQLDKTQNKQAARNKGSSSSSSSSIGIANNTANCK